MKLKSVTQKQNIMSFSVNLFLAFMMFGLPLVFTDGYHNITETKSTYFYILGIFIVLFAVVFFAADIITKRKSVTSLIEKPGIIDCSMLIFGAVILLSGIFSQYQPDVWFGSASRYQGVCTVLLYVAVYFAVSRNFRYSQSFLLCSIASLCLVSFFGVLNCFDIDIIGIYSYLSPGYKKDFISTIGNINFYSSFMCLMLPLVLCGFCSTKQKTSRCIYSIALIIGSFGMMITGSESFVIGFVFSVLVFPLFLMKDAEKLKKFLLGIIIILLSSQLFNIIYNSAPVKNIVLSKLLLFLLHPIVTAIIICICASVILVLHKTKHLGKIKIIYIAAFSVILFGIALLFILANTRGTGELDKYFKINEDWGTYRGGTWLQCIEKFKEFSLKEKLFGIGPESAFHVLDAQGVLAGNRLDQAHNEYLQYLLTTGIFGLLSYVSVIVSTVITVIRKLKDDILAVALLCALIAFWFQAIVNIAQPFTTPIMYIFISLIGGMCYNKTKNTEITS